MQGLFTASLNHAPRQLDQSAGENSIEKNSPTPIGQLDSPSYSSVLSSTNATSLTTTSLTSKQCSLLFNMAVSVFVDSLTSLILMVLLFIHPTIQFSNHSFIQPFNSPTIHSSNHSILQPFIHPIIHSSNHYFINSFSFHHSFFIIHPFIPIPSSLFHHPFIHLRLSKASIYNSKPEQYLNFSTTFSIH